MSYHQVPIEISDLPSSLTETLDYWIELKGTRRAPTWKQFDFLKIHPKMIPNLVVVDVVDAGKDFIYRFFGTENARAYGSEMTGKKTSELLPSIFAKVVTSSFQSIVEGQNPQAFQVDIDEPIGMPRFEYILRLPFSNDGATISQIMGVCWYSVGIDGRMEVFEGLTEKSEDG